jgi:ABC transport system ATP-binding/permease protein
VALLTVRDLGKSAAARTLFQQLSFTVQEGDRIGLIGPNGAGKSTLLRILAEEDTPDQGSVARRKEAGVGYLPQVDALREDATLERTLLDALKGFSLEEHEPILRVRKMLRRLGFTDPKTPVGTLSGGWRKRAALGRLLVQEPDCLLMDEPTNHLDLDGIAWLERFLERANFSFIVTTHDRYFLERVTNRIIEIDPRYPNGVLNVRGRYSDFLEQREQVLCSLDHERAALANEVRREVQWLRRGPKARSSKAGHRIDEAHRKIDQLSAHERRGQLVQDVSLSFNASRRQTQDLIVAEGVKKSLGGRLLFSDLDVRVLRGTRLGIVGNNATGKTTLLKVLTGDAPPDQGRVRPAHELRHALFDQHRAQLDPSESLRRALAPIGDIVTVPGRPTHVIAWAKRFGFGPDQLSMPLGELSGGEQARVLMATMMREPVDVLFLDEPTNDLDISSIEILEHALISFPGAVVLITHDRHMLDRVCTELIGLHGDGHWGTYASVLQWMEAEPPLRETASEDTPRQPVPRDPGPASRKPSHCVGLTYHEKKELAEIEQEILRAESSLERLNERLNEANLARDHTRLQELFEQREAAARRVSDLYARWEALEAKSNH